MGVSRRNSTYALISFFKQSETPMRIDAYDTIALALGGELNTALTGFTHDKSLGGPCAGNVQITLKGYVTAGPYEGMAWAELLDSGDWWAIDIVKNGVYQGLSFGVIDVVNVSVSAGATGAGAVTVAIAGRDYGFAMDDTPLYWNPFDPTIDNALGMNMLSILDQVSGKPHEVVLSMIRGLMGGLPTPGVLGGHTKVPAGLAGQAGSSYWVDHLDYTTSVQQDLRGFVFAASAVSPQGSPSAWAFVDAWRNPAMNEVFIDPKPLAFKEATGKTAVLVFREKPFVNAKDGANSPWFKLRTWNIEVSTIKALNLSKGANRVNHIAVTGDVVPAMGNDAYGLYPPVADLESIQKYGMKRLEENVRYFDDSGESGFATDSKDWLYLVVAWNCLNHRMWSGMIELGELRAEIRVGQKIALVGGAPAGYALQAGAYGLPLNVGEPVDPSALTFYVEKVSHTYTAGESPTGFTTLTVSYGYLEGDRTVDVLVETGKFQIPAPPAGSANQGEINVNTPEEDKQIDAGTHGGAEMIGDFTDNNSGTV